MLNLSIVVNFPTQILLTLLDFITLTILQEL